MNLSRSLEDYLEAIYHIVADKGVARPKDIGGRLKVQAASVTGALRALAQQDLVHYEPYEAVTLTTKGLGAARSVVHRHRTIQRFLTDTLGIAPQEAQETACKMEHAVTPEVAPRLAARNKVVAAETGIRTALNRSLRKTPESCGDAGEQVPGDSTKKLSLCREGDRITVVKASGGGAVKKRLLEMGFTKGTEATIVKYAPLKDPMEVVVKGSHVSLRVCEAEQILVESTEG
jgi:DtxR family Mn-dependent transcriptional regulator